jgi:WD40 repeat protein
VALSRDGRFAVCGSYDRRLRVWDLQGNQPPRILQGHTSWVAAVALSGDGRFAVSGSYDQTLRVWDLQGTQPPRILQGHTDTVSSVALSGDARFAVSGSYDQTLRVWDLRDDSNVTTFTCDAPVLCCSWTGSHVVAGDSLGWVHLFAWEM